MLGSIISVSRVRQSLIVDNSFEMVPCIADSLHLSSSTDLLLELLCIRWSRVCLVVSVLQCALVRAEGASIRTAPGMQRSSIVNGNGSLLSVSAFWCMDLSFVAITSVSLVLSIQKFREVVGYRYIL